MGSISEIGAAIIQAGASGDLKQLGVAAIRKKVDDDREFRKICDEYSDFSTGRTVLHHAVEIGHFEICKFLIKKIKVDIELMTYKRDTPLVEAAKGEHVKIVEFLIDQGAEISLANMEGFTALHYAVLKDNRELMELLQIKGALVDADSAYGTPLQIAVSRGNVEAVKSLLSHGANPDYFYGVADAPLVCAVKSRSFECLNLLLEGNADPNMYFVGISPLASAAKEVDTRFLKSLLTAGADPNSLLTDIFKPIEDAAMAHNREAVEILLPVTERLEHYPNWTCDGIIEFFHSEEFKTMREEKMRNRLTALDYGGGQDASNKEYSRAILKYRMAGHLDPSNPTWIVKRSLCQARSGKFFHSVVDAHECIKLNPDLPDPYRGGDIAPAANEIFKKFLMAGLAFSVEPYDLEVGDAFRVALFDYFAWLYQMSSAEEISGFPTITLPDD